MPTTTFRVSGFLSILFGLHSFVLAAEPITLAPPDGEPMSGHLKMGGKNPAGVEINANSRYLTLGGKPWLPVMGEFHYARYPHEQWERELLKMKAGGINIVSTYIFWIHHEEVEGQFDWAGDKDLRQFVQLCGKCGLYCYIRLGPWDHGEARNGGIPDWVMAKIPPRQLRTTDPAFMGLTKILYTEIFKQVQGLLYKDGGPIIGVQVENEMRGNAPYLLALKNMAREIGFDLPMYSMTGWGPAKVPEDELLPMFGGYTDGFWIDGHTVSPASMVQFFFTHNPNDERSTVKMDLSKLPANMAYLNQYPFLTCEIGGGMAISYARRPLMNWKDIAAAATCKLGDGSMLMGYYMYHGGGNPPGKLSTLQETQATNYPNDMPQIDYDFQAPIGQYGQIRPSYDALRLIHLFVNDFGSDLCLMPSTLPPKLPADMNDHETLRWAVRSDGHKGFIFINNYQRGVAMGAKEAQFDLKTGDGEQIVPATPVQFPADTFAIWPFNMDLNGVKLRYATAQLVCKVEVGGTPTYVFFTPGEMDEEFAFDAKGLGSVDSPGATKKEVDGEVILTGLHRVMGGVINLRAIDGRPAKILLLAEVQAMGLNKAKLWGKDRLLCSLDENLVFDGDNLTILHDEHHDMAVWVYPSPGMLSIGGQNDSGTAVGLFSHYSALGRSKVPSISYTKLKEAGPARAVRMGSKKKPEMPSDADFEAAAVWHVSIPKDALEGVGGERLRIDYVGDVARAYVGDRLIDDDFYYGVPWEIGLKQYAPEILEKGITLKILPLSKDFPVVMAEEKMPAFDAKGEALQLRSVEPVVEYEVAVEAGK